MGQSVTFVGQETSLKRKEVKKHIATIQCTNTLSLLQRKISNALLFHAYPKLKSVEEHHITVKQLCHFIDYNGNNHSAIKDSLKGLIATVVEWDLFDDITGEEDWSASSILASVRIKGPNCYYAYSPRMRELLHSPTIYAKINLIVQSKFKSAYGLALYENCIRYQGIPQTKWFEFEKFKSLMGVPKDTYPIFRDFKRRVLDKSIDEVNTYSDLFIQPEIERAGRKVIRIRFKLSVREKKKWLGENLIEKSKRGEGDQLTEEVIQKLSREFLLDKEKALSLVQTYGLDYIKEKIELVETSKSYEKGGIQNVTGYFMDALKNDYQKVDLKKIISEKSRVDYDKQVIQKNKQEKEEILNEKYEAYVLSKYEELILNLNNDERVKLLETFESYLKQYFHNITLNGYKRIGFKQPGAKTLLRKFLNEARPELMPKLISFDEFLLTIN